MEGDKVEQNSAKRQKICEDLDGLTPTQLRSFTEMVLGELDSSAIERIGKRLTQLKRQKQEDTITALPGCIIADRGLRSVSSSEPRCADG
eukprot:3787453-Rhodomonas_salina.2